MLGEYGCPIVTTPIGAEGITPIEEGRWGGLVEFDSVDFIKSSIDIYSNKKIWTACNLQATKLSQYNFDADKNYEQLCHHINKACEKRDERRRLDFTSAILWHDRNRCTEYFEYFSKWIEQKETGSSVQ